MNVVVVTPPELVVSLGTAKAHLRVDHDDDDTLIGAYLAAAISHIDGPGGWLGRAIGVQTLELRRADFCPRIRLPFAPIRAVQSVTYVDSLGAEKSFAGHVLDADQLAPAYGFTWPAPRGDAGGVRIQYQAGYDQPPPAIVAAILLMVGDLYAHRETVSVGAGASEIPMSTTAEKLLAPLRLWTL